MRKHILTAAALLLTGLLHAQARFGLKAGLNFAHVSANEPAISDYDKVWPTFLGGLITDFSAGDNFSFQPQVIIQLLTAGDDADTPLFQSTHAGIETQVPEEEPPDR